jgi:hypothetical protein
VACRKPLAGRPSYTDSFGISARVAIPPLAVEVSGIPKSRRRRKPVPAPKILGEDDALRTSVPGRAGR